jgi:hypothetical protein
MKKIAIIKYHDVCPDYYDTNLVIANSITEWSEVTDEQYNLLREAQRLGSETFVIIERPTNEREVIDNSIAGYLKWAEQEQQRRQAERQQREQAAIARRIKKEAKTQAEQLKLYQQLKAQFEK